MTCFENIIGLTPDNCTCFPDIDSAKVSNSGLYMDQLEESVNLKVFKSAADCDQSLVELFERARANAIGEFRKALYMEIGTRYTPRYQPYEGAVGGTSGTALLNLAYQYAGVALDTQPIRGAEVTVRSIQPQFNFNGTLEVIVFKAIQNGTGYQVLETVTSIQLTAAINNPGVLVLSTPLKLEATDSVGRALSYLFVYERTGFQPRNNSTSCGCGAKEVSLHKYLRPQGILGTGPTSFQFANRNPYVNGLVLTVDIHCGDGDFICANYAADEFVRESVNWAVLYKAVALSISGVLNSQLINRYTMAGREQMAHNVNVLNGKFRKSVAWLSEKMDLSGNDCFVYAPTGGGNAFSYQMDKMLL